MLRFLLWNFQYFFWWYPFLPSTFSPNQLFLIYLLPPYLLSPMYFFHSYLLSHHLLFPLLSTFYPIYFSWLIFFLRFIPYFFWGEIIFLMVNFVVSYFLLVFTCNFILEITLFGGYWDIYSLLKQKKKKKKKKRSKTKNTKNKTIKIKQNKGNPPDKFFFRHEKNL